jgi:hypothetical protein
LAELSSQRRPGLPEIMRTSLRAVFRRDRVTGQVAIGLVGVLAVTAVVFGVGLASARYRVSDIGAWLSATKKNSIVHANGLAGKVDGKGQLPKGMAGHQIEVHQDGNTILLVDRQTGVVARIDPTTFDVGRGSALGSAEGLRIVTGSGSAYALDHLKGTVQRIDPMTLGVVGGESQLTAPLGSAAIDGKGVLWVPEGNTGHVVPFQNGRRLPPVTVGRPGDTLALTVAAGLPVVTNSTQPAATVVGLSGPQLKVTLPSVVSAQKQGVLAPSAADGQIVPLLAPDQGALMLVNAGDGTITSATLRLPAGHEFQPPQVLGARVYIPDTTDGALRVYNTMTGGYEKTITVPEARGHRNLEVFVKDGLLWVNNPDGAQAVVVDGAGQPKAIGKYDPDVPGGAQHPIPKAGNPQGNQGDPHGGGNGPGGAQTPPPAPKQTKTPTPFQPPDPPAALATQGSGSITVTFAPAAGGAKPTGFALRDGVKDSAPPGTVSPTQIAADATDRTFTVSGLTCGTEYRFRVAVRFKDNKGKDGVKYSDPTVPTLSCRPPGTPSNLRSVAQNHAAQLDWDPPQSDGGGRPGYLVSMNGGAPQSVSGTHFAASGLTNGQTYTFEVKALNKSGNSDPLSGAVTLDPAAHAVTYNGHNNDNTSTWLHVGPTLGSAHPSPPNDKFPRYFSGPVSVICQVRSDHVTDANNSSLQSNVWDKINYGGVKWVSDLYVNTPGSNSGQLSGTVWECT